MKPLYSSAALRTIETRAAARLPAGTLMQRAGQAGASAALALLPPHCASAKVLVLAGPGNNGGDALETASHLAAAGAQVTIMEWAPSGQPSLERSAALQRARASAASLVAPAAALVAANAWDLVVDGLFGIGLQRPVSGTARSVVEAVNQLNCPVLALDLPSGLTSDSGAVVGPDGVAIHASHTLTFIGDKPGLHTCDGRDHAGLVSVDALAIDGSDLEPSDWHLNAPEFFARHLRTRRHNSHKGSYGNVAVLGGAPGMAGAPLLAARAALHSGAGRVYALYVETALACDPGQPELMCRAATGFDLNTATLVVGPGLGTSTPAADLLARAIASDSALLVDADALNLLAGNATLQAALALRRAPTLLTPHPLEAARLLATDIAAVQADRIAAARQLAASLHAWVVLKGSGSVIAAPNGAVVINTTGNPALATAGTGDVLSGVCGSLMAQGWPAWEAALAGVWLHGQAADTLVTSGVGPIGLTAGELIPAIRRALNAMVAMYGH